MCPLGQKASKNRTCVKIDVTEFSPVTMNGCTLSENHCLECLLGLKETSWNPYIRSIAKYGGNRRFPVPLQNLPYSSRHAISIHEIDQTKNGISGPELPNFHFPISTVFKCLCVVLFSTLLNVPSLHCYVRSRFSGEQHSLVPSVQTFTSRTRQATYIKLIHPYSLHISLQRRNFYSVSFFSKELSQCGTMSQENAFLSLKS